MGKQEKTNWYKNWKEYENIDVGCFDKGIIHDVYEYSLICGHAWW